MIALLAWLLLPLLLAATWATTHAPQGAQRSALTLLSLFIVSLTTLCSTHVHRIFPHQDHAGLWFMTWVCCLLLAANLVQHRRHAPRSAHLARARAQG